MIKIYDTKAREKRPFVPVADGKVNMYAAQLCTTTSISEMLARLFRLTPFAVI